MKKRYTHLFFDLDNTLWDFGKNSLSAMQISYSYFCIKDQQVDFERFFRIYSTHNHKLWEEYRKGEVVKKELTRLRFQRTLNDIGITNIDPVAMNAFYLAVMPEQKCLVAGAIELLEYLKKKGYILFIITNGFREVQHKKLEATGLKRYFTKVFISEDIKAPKPAGEIFEYAVKSANAKKTSSLMIGDDPETDVEGALNFGIDAVFYNPQGKQYSKTHFSGNSLFTIHTLLELKNVV